MKPSLGKGKRRIDYAVITPGEEPGAFRRYAFREDMFLAWILARPMTRCPRTTTLGRLEYVRILHLAAADGEETVRLLLAQCSDSASVPKLRSVRAVVADRGYRRRTVFGSGGAGSVRSTIAARTDVAEVVCT